MLWAPGSEELPWYHIDQWSINKGRYQYYNDHVHFIGPLSFATVMLVLNELCPGGGQYTWRYPADVKNITATLRDWHQPIVLQLSVNKATSWHLLVNGVRHLIPNKETLDGMEIDTKWWYGIQQEDLKLFQEGKAVQPCKPMGNVNNCQDNEFYKALHVPLTE